MDLRVVSKAASSSKQDGLMDAWIFVTKWKYKQFKHFQVTNVKDMPITEVQQRAHNRVGMKKNEDIEATKCLKCLIKAKHWL